LKKGQYPENNTRKTGEEGGGDTPGFCPVTIVKKKKRRKVQTVERKNDNAEIVTMMKGAQ